MNKRTGFLHRRVAALGLSLGLVACGGASESPLPVAGPPGVLSISAMPQLDPYPATAQQYAALLTQSFNLAYGAGARGQVSTWTWKELEPTQGSYDASKFTDLDNAITNAVNHGMLPFVGVQLINTTVLEVPADLASQALDSPAMQTRFKALLDKLITPHKGKIKYLSIGNEVDAYLRQHPADWARYKAFYNAMAAYARTLDPALKVGVTSTADGALVQSPNEVRELNTGSDVLILTYYPIQFNAQGGVSVRGPGVVAADVDAMLALAGSRPLVLQEVGYPAATSNGSSAAQQADFVSQVFTAWKVHPDRIPFLNFFLLHDFTPQMCADFGVYYGAAGSATFADFLCTLGLREANGTPRPAWGRLVDEAKAAKLP